MKNGLTEQKADEIGNWHCDAYYEQLDIKC